MIAFFGAKGLACGRARIGILCAAGLRSGGKVGRCGSGRRACVASVAGTACGSAHGSNALGFVDGHIGNGIKSVADGGQAAIKRQTFLFGQAAVDFLKHGINLGGDNAACLHPFFCKVERVAVALRVFIGGFQIAFFFQVIQRTLYGGLVFFAALAQLGRSQTT